MLINKKNVPDIYAQAATPITIATSVENWYAVWYPQEKYGQVDRYYKDTTSFYSILTGKENQNNIFIFMKNTEQYWILKVIYNTQWEVIQEIILPTVPRDNESSLWNCGTEVMGKFINWYLYILVKERCNEKISKKRNKWVYRINTNLQNPKREKIIEWDLYIFEISWDWTLLRSAWTTRKINK